jgi:hypothetical protein
MSKLATFGLVTAIALSSSLAFAQGRGQQAELR